MTQSTEQTKRCSICKTSKPVSEFYPQRKRNGYMNYCKVCSRKKAKLWSVRNAVHIRRYKGEYRERRRGHYTQLQRNYIARLKAEGKYHEFLRRKREWYRRRRQYLPCPGTLKRAHEREAAGRIDGRRLHPKGRFINAVVKVHAALQERKEE
jgi:hypothetical protein